MSERKFKSMEFWRAKEREKDGGKPSSSKAHSVPRTPLISGSGGNVKQTETFASTGNATEGMPLRRSGKKLRSNAATRSKGAFRPQQSTSAFESTATWYTDEVVRKQDDKDSSAVTAPASPRPVKTEHASPTSDKRRSQWCTETTTYSTSVPTVSITTASSPSEERGDTQALVPSSHNDHKEQGVLSSPRKPPPPPPPPPYRSTHPKKDTTIQDTSPGKMQLPARAFSSSKTNSKMGGSTLSPSQSMGKLDAMSPSLLSSRGPKRFSLCHTNHSNTTSDLQRPSQLVGTPVTPKEDLFVSASRESMEEVVFSALLQRVLQDGDRGSPFDGQVPSSAPPCIQCAFPSPSLCPSPSASLLSPAHGQHRRLSLTRGSPVPLSRDELFADVSSFYSKLNQFKCYVKAGPQVNSEVAAYVLLSVEHLSGLLHCTKVLCCRLLEVLPPSISTAVLSLKRSAEKYIQSNASVSEPLFGSLEKLEKSVEQFVADCCGYLRVGYQLRGRLLEEEAARMKLRLGTPKISTPLKVYVGCVGRLPKTIGSGDYSLHVSVCCGGETLTKKRMPLLGRVDSEGLLPCIMFNQWLDLGIALSHLPLESRLVFALLPEGQALSTHEPLACGTVCTFLPNKDFWSGTHLLCLWPGDMYKHVCAGVPCPNATESGGVVLYIRLDNCNRDQPPICYAEPQQLTTRSSRQYDLSLEHIQQLKVIVAKEHFTALTQEERDLLWESRHQLCSSSITSHLTVPMLVRAIPGNSPSYRAELYALLNDFKIGDTMDAFALLTPSFADSKVRGFAVKWLYRLSNSEVTTFLPQIVQSLKSDWLDSSPTAEFLLVKARGSREIAHHLYWTLHQVTEDPVYAPRYRRLWSALIKVLQKDHAEDLHRQRLLVESLVEVAGKVKEAKDKKAVLLQELREVERLLKRESSLPLNPAVRVKGLNLDKCSFFSSFTVPLKLSFKCGEGRPDVGVIFKAGDDLRQDMIVMQMIRLFDDMWKKAGLDLKIITYGVVATGQDTGMLEFVEGCETLREIQTTQGVTGSFKDHVLADWLTRHNSTKTAYKQAVETFTASCAGYCVASYVLGIGDRHNDNIMVTSKGHMFHIDYGKILGHAQMFGNIKRDRAPFVFTPDMAFVINGGGDKGANFQHFTDLCCTAYQELRRHTNLIINLLELMLPSGLPELSSVEDIQYVSQALLPGVSVQQACSRFTRLIEDSLSSVSTQINFVIHNLGQRKSVTKAVEDLLSFVPGRFSITTDGAITAVEVTGFRKRIKPEKFYDYKVVVEREGGRKDTIFRRYREFHEFNEKLKEACPGVQLPALPEKLLFHRSHVQQVSEQRQVLLNQFLQDVMALPPAVSQCDLIYTFLHRMVRDEHDLDREVVTEGEAEVKLDMKYNRTHNQVTITVMHAKNLPQPTSVKGPPDPYVKMYVTPDLHKKSKQRTKAVESTHNPTYNETFFYPVGQDDVDSYSLQVSVWTKSILGGKECLGQTEIKLHLLQLLGGVSQWYKLHGDTKVVSLWSSTHPA